MSIKKKNLLTAIFFSFAVLLQTRGDTQVTIDCLQTSGKIKPLHGVNLGPLCYRGTIDLSKYHRELKIPYTRLHDVVWVNADAVDISTIFRDFRNPADDPASYDFRITDDYLKAIINVGSKIVYRLGESIEHTPRKYRVNPPSDFEKWAEICAKIISHYNEGWANGFHYNIEYWEIWNEPDVKPAMWTGTDEQFFQLYGIASKKIKSAFPKIKVGGPALGNPIMNENSNPQPTPYLAKFLAYCRERNLPLDFFSWHCYTADPQVIARKAVAVRKILDDYGFKNTESHLNEWNYLPRNDWAPMLGDNPEAKEKWYAEMGGPDGAVFLTTVLIIMHDLPIDVANFYTGEIQGFGLFNYFGAPKKNYFAMKAFSKLLDTPNRLKTSVQSSNVNILAGMDNKSTIHVLASVKTTHPENLVFSILNLPWDGKVKAEVYTVDKDKNLELAESKTLEVNLTNEDKNRLIPSLKINIPVQSPSVFLIVLKRDGGK